MPGNEFEIEMVYFWCQLGWIKECLEWWQKVLFLGMSMRMFLENIGWRASALRGGRIFSI